MMRCAGRAVGRVRSRHGCPQSERLAFANDRSNRERCIASWRRLNRSYRHTARSMKLFSLNGALRKLPLARGHIRPDLRLKSGSLATSQVQSRVSPKTSFFSTDRRVLRVPVSVRGNSLKTVTRTVSNGAHRRTTASTSDLDSCRLD